MASRFLKIDSSGVREGGYIKPINTQLIDSALKQKQGEYDSAIKAGVSAQSIGQSSLGKEGKLSLGTGMGNVLEKDKPYITSVQNQFNTRIKDVTRQLYNDPNNANLYKSQIDQIGLEYKDFMTKGGGGLAMRNYKDAQDEIERLKKDNTLTAQDKQAMITFLEASYTGAEKGSQYNPSNFYIGNLPNITEEASKAGLAMKADKNDYSVDKIRGDAVITVSGETTYVDSKRIKAKLDSIHTDPKFQDNIQTQAFLDIAKILGPGETPDPEHVNDRIKVLYQIYDNAFLSEVNYRQISSGRSLKKNPLAKSDSEKININTPPVETDQTSISEKKSQNITLKKVMGNLDANLFKIYPEKYNNIDDPQELKNELAIDREALQKAKGIDLSSREAFAKSYLNAKKSSESLQEFLDITGMSSAEAKGFYNDVSNKVSFVGNLSKEDMKRPEQEREQISKIVKGAITSWENRPEDAKGWVTVINQSNLDTRILPSQMTYAELKAAGYSFTSTSKRTVTNENKAVVDFGILDKSTRDVEAGTRYLESTTGDKFYLVDDATTKYSEMTPEEAKSVAMQKMALKGLKPKVKNDKDLQQTTTKTATASDGEHVRRTGVNYDMIESIYVNAIDPDGKKVTIRMGVPTSNLVNLN